MIRENRINGLFRLGVWICLLSSVSAAIAQTDSLILSNGNILIGEVKSMDKSILIIETTYSDKDFTVKWKEIDEIYTSNQLLITLTDGRWFSSTLKTIRPGELVILDEQGQTIEIKMMDIVYLEELKADFWSRITAGADLGLNLTKANNLRQLNFSVKLGYLTERYRLNSYYEFYGSSQDSISSTVRKEGQINFMYLLQEDWYILPFVSYLSNTEQALHSRISPNFGFGRFLARNNRLYWGIFGGLAFNKEVFTNETADRKSADIYAGSTINLFDFGDLDLQSQIFFYPSLTEKGRFRTDFKLDTRFEFADDFYIKLNLTYNYDNRPAIPGNEGDYVFGISVGWEK